MNDALSRRDLDCMRISADLALLPLDDDVVAFSEQSQCVIGLNGSAAFLIEQLQSGMTPGELASELAAAGSVTAEESSRWVSSLLESLAAHGLTEASASRSDVEGPQWGQKRAARAAQLPPYAPFEVAAEKNYRLLDICARIRCARPDQLAAVDSVIGHLAAEEASSPAVTIDIAAAPLPHGHVRSLIYLNGQPFNFASGIFRLAPMIKGALWDAAVTAHDFRFYVHAGVVGANGHCILFPAAAGSGKSSLTAALAHRGFRYFSDEVALLENGTFNVPPVPLAFCVKNTGWDVIARIFPQLLDMSVHERADGKVVRYLPPDACGVEIAKASAPVSHIIFPRYHAKAQTELTPVNRSEALRRMMAECLALRERLTRQNVEELIHWISNIECYELIFSSLEEACRRIEAVTAEPSGSASS